MPPAGDDPGQKTILIVDDDQGMRDTLARS